MPHRFTATVYKLGINPCVDVPQRVSQAFGKRGYVPVVGTLNGQPIRATLVPKGGGFHRLYLNGEMRKRAQVKGGDAVNITLERDTQPRDLPMPEALALALEQNPSARAVFDRLTASRKKEILSYLNWLKRPETLKKNVDRLIAELLKSPEH
jgi:hypothetical protein